MSSPPPQASLPSLEDTFGAALVGCMLSSMLYGMSIVQLLYYYTNYSKDSKYLRILVAVAFTFDTVPLILAFDTQYFYLVKNFNHPDILGRSIWTAQLGVLFGALTAVVVQCFYILRVWRLSRSGLLTSVILGLSLTEFAISIFWVTRTLRITTFDKLEAVKNWTIVANVLQAVVDVSSAVSICYLLHTARSAFKQTNAIINRLILFFINTGLMTSIFAISVVISSAVSPHSFINAAFYLCVGRLYTNSLLAALNGRRIVRGGVEDIDITLPSLVVKTASTSTTVPGTLPVTFEHSIPSPETTIIR